MKPKIDPNKKYTSGGHPVELLHRTPEGWPGRFPWRGIVNGAPSSWTDDGWVYSGTASSEDLIEVREPLEVMIVVNCRSEVRGLTLIEMVEWDRVCPNDAPHTLRKFREVIE